MTGIYIRTKTSDAKDVIELTDEEWADFVETQKDNATYAWRFARVLAQWIKTNVEPNLDQG